MTILRLSRCPRCRATRLERHAMSPRGRQQGLGHVRKCHSLMPVPEMPLPRRDWQWLKTGKSNESRRRPEERGYASGCRPRAEATSGYDGPLPRAPGRCRPQRSGAVLSVGARSLRPRLVATDTKRGRTQHTVAPLFSGPTLQASARGARLAARLFAICSARPRASRTPKFVLGSTSTKPDEPESRSRGHRWRTEVGSRAF